MKDRLLIANRGEIAIRIARAAADCGLESVAIGSADDINSLHLKKADVAVTLDGTGAAAYLDSEQIIRMAIDQGCKYVHPGYGFLSENADFARGCAEAGLVFVGPSPETLELFGDKVQARVLAGDCGVPLLEGSSQPVNVAQAKVFLDAQGENGAIVIKAVAGGGGRGMRVVEDPAELESAFERCQSEALSAFGQGEVYVERLIKRARHIEIQVVGDGSGQVIHLGERDCSLQRRHQKVIEIAPGPSMSDVTRDKLTSAALKMAAEVNYKSLGTFEFLLDDNSPEDDPDFAFIEANPRLQVEHTITEEVTGVDLVRTQIDIARGSLLSDLGLDNPELATPKGVAIQLRVNMESMGEDGEARPAGGTLQIFEPPTGPGVRVDTFGYGGYQTSASFDSLLAKVIVHSAEKDFTQAVNKAYRALCEFNIDGVPTNIPFMQNILQHPEFLQGDIFTRFVEANGKALVAQGSEHQRYYFETTSPGASELADSQSGPKIEAPDGTVAVAAPIQGTIVSVDVSEGDSVAAGQQVLVMEAMKMEHVIKSDCAGLVRQVTVAPGDTVYMDHALVFVDPAEEGAGAAAEEAEIDLDYIRPDLAELMERHHLTTDAARPDAVEKRRATGQRTARENVEDIVDEGSFIEYGPLVIAMQRSRRAMDDLIRRTPADGLVSGVGEVNGELFGHEASKCAVFSYDYTVMAGTQGMAGHSKTDRIISVAERQRLPFIFFTEGGGGRPGDTDFLGPGGGMDCLTFGAFGGLSGLVPLVGINSGYCFAGNAAILGCCDVVIATENSSIGMGGPAMIEGGNLGVYRPEDIGPTSVQVPNGVIDILVKDEAEAVQAAKQYLSYFQGTLSSWNCADQRKLRHLIPENRLRIYDVREVIQTLVDEGSVLELRPDFSLGMITAFARIEGRPVGIVANNPVHLAGAIQADGGDKASRFIQLCDAFDIPILSLIDTPGIMVGPEAEKTALVRHANRLMVTGSSITVPMFSVVLRKSYGLGAIAMAGGNFKKPAFAVSWPTGEFGGMGLEGSVKLGYRKEIEAMQSVEEQQAFFDRKVAEAYEQGKALNIATHTELDNVIDPADTRKWIVNGLQSSPKPLPRSGKKRPMVDTW